MIIWGLHTPLHHTGYNRNSHGNEVSSLCFHPVLGSCSFPLTPSQVAVRTRYCFRQTMLTYGGAYVQESLAPMASFQSGCWCVTHSMLELCWMALPAGASKTSFFFWVWLEQLPRGNKIKCFFASHADSVFSPFQLICGMKLYMYIHIYIKKKSLNLSDKKCVYLNPHLSSSYFVQNPSLFQRGKLKKGCFEYVQWFSGSLIQTSNSAADSTWGEGGGD